MNRSLLVAIALFSVCQAAAQNVFRVGLGYTFAKDSSSFIQSFSFDFNRSEDIREKVGNAVLKNSKGYYIVPTSDINIGPTVSSSENNVFVQLGTGKAWLRDPETVGTLTKRSVNTSLEISPTYMADKVFSEELVYGAFKWSTQVLAARFRSADHGDFIRKEMSFSIGPVCNIGFRDSQKFAREIFYLTGGLFMDLKMRYLKKVTVNKKVENVENWVFRLNGYGVSILQEMGELYGEDLAGQIIFSADKRVVNKLFVNLSYKLGNNNPNYKQVNVGEAGLKLKY